MQQGRHGEAISAANKGVKRKSKGESIIGEELWRQRGGIWQRKRLIERRSNGIIIKRGALDIGILWRVARGDQRRRKPAMTFSSISGESVAAAAEAAEMVAASRQREE